jgi:nitrogen regulatory protein PII 1
MKMIRAIIRPEKEHDVVLALEGGGFAALTKAHVFGRGKQKGLQVGPVRYDMLSKVHLTVVVEDDDLEKVMGIISDSAKTGFIGDGKVFVSDVEEVYTVRTGDSGL